MNTWFLIDGQYFYTARPSAEAITSRVARTIPNGTTLWAWASFAGKMGWYSAGNWDNTGRKRMPGMV